MESIAIVGVGLIGGSLALGLRKAGFSGTILGVSSPATIAQAVESGVIDRGATLAEAAALVDVIYLSQPIGGILRSIEALGSLARPGTLVTDAGSTKSAICRRAAEVLAPGTFLGGHPMAGKESRGVGEAEADLFRGHTYVFTPEMDAEQLTPIASDFKEWIVLLGARPVLLSPREHDRIVSLTSHLPQLASTALGALLAGELTHSADFQVSGSGLRDMTRLALSSYEIWADIVATNADAIQHALNVYIDKLTEIRDNLHTHRLSDTFCTAADTVAKIRR